MGSGPTTDGGRTLADGPSRAGEERRPGDSAPDVDGADETDAVERTLVRITSDVGQILGVDERPYELSAEDVVTLPEPNADPLVERDAAERL